MNLAKNSLLIFIAVLIDAFQAVISGSIAMIAAFPGTVGGAGAGLACAAASKNFLVDIGCWAGGGVLALFGTALNPLLAVATIPIGMVVGFAINLCLSVIAGAFLLTIMMFSHTHISWKRLLWSGGEIIPGLNNIPFWTFFVIASLWGGAPGKKQRKGILGVASAFLQPARAVMSVKEGAASTLQHAKERGERWNMPVEVPEPEIIRQPTSARELVRASERIPFQDVRPTKPNAKTA